MDELLARAWSEIVGRLTGPMHVRFIVQPVVAAILATRAARASHDTDWPSMSELWRDIGRLCVVAFALDTIYQLLFLRVIHPVQSFVIVLWLAVAPYLVVRTAVSRFARRGRHV